MNFVRLGPPAWRWDQMYGETLHNQSAWTFILFSLSGSLIYFKIFKHHIWQFLRKFESVEQKLFKVNTHYNFNLACLYKDVLPNCTDIYIHVFASAKQSRNSCWFECVIKPFFKWSQRCHFSPEHACNNVLNIQELIKF